jgi:putative transcriptional regulator
MASRETLDHVEVSMKNKLKVLRAERDWSQAKLAILVGVSRQSINAIEKGKYDPSLPLAFRLADVFDLKIEDIFIQEDIKKGDES